MEDVVAAVVVADDEMQLMKKRVIQKLNVISRGRYHTGPINTRVLHV